jgi:hypothetical protein
MCVRKKEKRKTKKGMVLRHAGREEGERTGMSGVTDRPRTQTDAHGGNAGGDCQHAYRKRRKRHALYVQGRVRVIAKGGEG